LNQELDGPNKLLLSQKSIWGSNYPTTNFGNYSIHGGA
jgi:hypothetical protein